MLLAAPYADRNVLSLSEFYDLLAAAFTADAPAFDEGWRANPSSPNNLGCLGMLALKVRASSLTSSEQKEPAQDHVSSHLGWRSTLVGQIVDLREMDEAGVLRDVYRYYGVGAPRGSRWYNFDPATYIECAVAGAFGGWEPGDPGDRQLVPGEVAVLRPDGEIESRDPTEIEHPIHALPGVDWAALQEFILCGQMYE